MNKAGWVVCVIMVAANASAGDARERTINGVRFSAFAAATDRIELTARGMPGQTPTELRAAFDVRARELCPATAVQEPLTQGEYDYLQGGNQVTMAAGGALLNMTQYHLLKKAPTLSATLVCTRQADAALPRAQPFNVYVKNELGENISYIDQGFASFNRAQLDVPVAGVALRETLVRSIGKALGERGYQAVMVDTQAAADVTITVSKAHVPQEQFNGIALLTKIGLIGLSNLSAEFCSVAVTVQRKDSADQLYASGVSTRKLIKPVYGNWARDMAAGPAPDLHIKTSAALSQTLADDVAAAIHGMPPSAFDPGPAMPPAASH